MSSLIINPYAFGPPPDSSISYITNNASADTLNATSYTATGLDIGIPGSNRHVIVSVVMRSNTNPAPNDLSMTIGGIAATQIATAVNIVFRTAIFIAAVPTGTTANIVLTTASAGTLRRVRFGVYAAYDLNSATVTSTGNSTATNPTASLSVSAGGIAVGVVYTNDVTSFTWTGLTENYDSDSGTGISTSTGASIALASANPSLTVTATPGISANPCGCFASFR